MNTSLFLTALCLGIASAAPEHDQSLDSQWYQWKATYRRLYGMVGNMKLSRGTMRERPSLLGVFRWRVASRNQLLPRQYLNGTHF